MIRLAMIVLAGLAGTVAATEAGACRIRRQPIIPIMVDYDAAVLATVTRHDANRAEVRLDEVLEGRVEGDMPGLTFGNVSVHGDVVVTSCGAPGPPVVTGDRVVVVFGRNGDSQYVLGWVTLDFAAQADDFFALYRRAGPGARWRLRARWRQVNRTRGPVPVTDPGRWLPPYASDLGWGPGEFLNAVGFRVAADGHISECYALQGTTDPRTDAICARIRDRRFLPPMLARERHGFFRVDWNGDPPL